VGAAIIGMPPVVDLWFSEFITIAMDQVVQQAANLRHIFRGQINVPMVLRAPTGAYLSAAGHYSHSLESWFSVIPGIEVVLPSVVYDAKALLDAAIRDDNLVPYLEDKKLYDKKMRVPEESYTTSIRDAAVKLQGSDISLVAWSFLVSKALEAAAQRISVAQGGPNHRGEIARDRSVKGIVAGDQREVGEKWQSAQLGSIVKPWRARSSKYPSHSSSVARKALPYQVSHRQKNGGRHPMVSVRLLAATRNIPSLAALTGHTVRRHRGARRPCPRRTFPTPRRFGRTTGRYPPGALFRAHRAM